MVRDVLTIVIYSTILAILVFAPRDSQLWNLGMLLGGGVLLIAVTQVIKSLLDNWRAARIPQPANFISVLLDENAAADDRYQAADSLAYFDEPEAMASLMTVANNTADDVLLDICVDSIVDIWERNGVWAENEFSKFNARAQAVVRRQFIDPEAPSPPTFTEIR